MGYKNDRRTRVNDVGAGYLTTTPDSGTWVGLGVGEKREDYPTRFIYVNVHDRKDSDDFGLILVLSQLVYEA